MKKIIPAAVLAIGLSLTATAPVVVPQVAQAQQQRNKSHRIGNITFQASSNWLSRTGAKGQITIDNKKPATQQEGWADKDAIRVMANVIDQNLDTVISAKPGSRSIESETLKTENLTIGGQRAVKLYQAYNDGFPAGILTYIATGKNQTTLIATYYADRSTEVQAERIHQTIRIVK
jgi:opacity protein-like surface antigen